MTAHNEAGPNQRPRPARDRRARSLAVAVSSRLASASYVQKWLVLGVVIGVIAGVGAIVFYEALTLASHLLLGDLVGYKVPTPVGEGGFLRPGSPARAWLLPVVVGAGALVAALLVFRVAPEAEGHGTDAAISAVHHDPRGVRFRAVLVKIVASALTIGAGGSGGREGPTGQISAGFGSLLARVLDLDPADARIAVATGIGSGIGSIFSAPLGGAVLAAEILYREDFDPAALLPSFIASAVGYVIFAAVEGFNPLFGFHGAYRFDHPSQLVWFALIGVLGGLVGLLYAKSFYGVAEIVKRLPGPKWMWPAVGGVLVGLIGLAVPQVLGTGYGWIQESMGRQLLGIPLWIVVLLPLARILATSLSIGTGGSGGIFGPGMVIGAFVGAAVWRLFEPHFPSMGHDPAAYVIVGMMACFGGISRAPLAVMLMVAEMTGSLSIIPPAMVAVGLSWLIVRHVDDTMYRSQLADRRQTRAARVLVGLPLLATVPVRRAMRPPRLVLDEGTAPDDALAAMQRAGVRAAPVVDAAGRFEGTVDAADLPGARSLRAVVDAAAPITSLDAQLDAGLEALTITQPAFVPVLDRGRRVHGTLAVSDLVRAYRAELLASLTPADRTSAAGAISQLEAGPDDPWVGHPLRDGLMPGGVVVTAVQRGNALLTPDGGTVIQPGDRLSVIGPVSDSDQEAALLTR